MNKAAFYDAIRDDIRLTSENVPGFDRVLDYGEARGTPLNHFAYILATASWETANTMQPVKEAYWLSEAWRKKHLRYYPWYGRGLIQTTWERNYATMSNEIGMDLIANPDLLLTWEAALPALFVGMEKGLYTGRDLDDYIDEIDESDDEDLREYINARRIVNGTDRAKRIGKLALVFERGLKAAGYGESDRFTIPKRITIVIESREDGGLRVSSQDLPGFILSHSDASKVIEDISPALSVLLFHEGD